VGSDLFLSYSRADRPLAEQFVRTAAARGVNVWYDEDIEGGRDWREKIVAALGSAKALVILFSEHSNDSRQLIKELAVADNMRKQVIPVLISNCEPQGPYLYELASRNWIPIYPNPESKLAWLIDKLVTEQEPRGVSLTEQEPRGVGLLSTVPAHGDHHSWSPLRRSDVYILVPILVGGFLISLFSSGDNKDWGLGISAIASFVYMIIFAVRNARSNRGVFSGKSFFCYFALLVIGVLPALVIGGSAEEKISTFGGLIILSLLVAVVANVLQVFLRKIFQQNIFRSRIKKPLAS
jgi:TIR domain